VTLGTARPTRREIRRYGHVIAVLARYGFDDILDRLNAGHEVPWHGRLFRREVRHLGTLSTAQRVRLVLEELGPTYIKFGQLLSGRPDLLPEDFIRELNRLQDEVPSFPFHDVRAIIEGQFGRPLEELYAEFDESPVGAASLAQVHRARTHDGNEVAVKVQRPGIEETIDADLRILRRLAALAERHLPDAAFFEPAALVDGFAVSLHHELDFIREGRTADGFRKFFERDETVHVPKVHWDLTTANVLTLEYIRGIKVSDYTRLESEGLDRKAIARNGANLLLREVFEYRKFHGDPHPGNLFVLENNVVAPVDYGMTGRLEQERVDQLGQLIIGMAERDVRAMADVLMRMCGAEERTHGAAFRSQLADLVDRYDGAGLKEFNLGGVLNGVTTFLRRDRAKLPHDMAMLSRSLIIIESVGCGLYPEFNILDIMEPYARELVIRRSDPARALRGIGRTLEETAALVTALPAEVGEIIARIKRNELALQCEVRGLDRLRSGLERTGDRLGVALVIAALIVGSSLAMPAGGGPMVFGQPVQAVVGLMTVVAAGLWLFIGLVRSRRI
jgi:ubiquinone biosynthesis protein